jgi:hypothetical protein
MPQDQVLLCSSAFVPKPLHANLTAMLLLLLPPDMAAWLRQTRGLRGAL